MSFWKEAIFIINGLMQPLTSAITGINNANNALNSNTHGLGAIKTGVDGANSALGDSTNGLAAIKSAVDAISSGGGSSAIKSIQRGTLSLNQGAANMMQSVTINAVNRNKSIVLLNTTTSTAANPATHGAVLLGFPTDTQINIGITSYGASVVISWQVIEFN